MAIKPISSTMAVKVDKNLTVFWYNDRVFFANHEGRDVVMTHSTVPVSEREYRLKQYPTPETDTVIIYSRVHDLMFVFRQYIAETGILNHEWSQEDA